MRFQSVIVILLFTITSCSDKKITQPAVSDFILTEKDLIPEGVAWDSITGSTFVSSTYKRKVVQVDKDGNISDFIPAEKDGIWSTVGMEADPKARQLWINLAHANAVMPLQNPDTTRDWMTSIVCYDIDSKKFLYRFDCPDKQAFFNDVTIGNDHAVYITESVNNKIYRVNASRDTLDVFLTPTGLSFLNGLTFGNDNNTLFVSCNEGILSLNVSTKQYTLLPGPSNVEEGGIDGLAYYKNSLIGHQNKIVSRFYLNADENVVDSVKVIASGEEFDSSTTGEVGGDYYYFIVNSQIRSAIDQTSHTLKPADSLENIIIRKITL